MVESVVCGLASHTSLGDSLSLTLLISPFQVRPTSGSDYRTGAIGLLGFYRFIAFIVIGPPVPLDFYRLRYSYFRLLVYIVFYISDVIDVGLLGLLLPYRLLYYMKIIII
ncbi:unnamed protein product [Brassica napus]|uniref:(rape) hypothetical protein n=1 Tax=Brassica napus TaxID=3708 RepID=A0A816RMD3_BRANA|nr:unnamed protein product [Brassica napus]